MLLRGRSLVNARGEGGLREAPEGQRMPLRRAQDGAYGTVMVVPSPVPTMENVPAVLDVYV